MKRITHLVALISLFLCVGCATDQLSLQGRKDWVNQRVPELRAFTPVARTVAVPVQIHERHATVGAHQGFVRLHNDEWVYFKSCSSHDSSVADVILAIDNTGNLYGANGHVCPALQLILRKNGTLQSAQDFFATRVVDNNDGWKRKRWHLVDEKN